MYSGFLLYIVVLAIWMILSVLSNLSIALVILRDCKMRTNTNLYICSVALSDIILAGFVLPMRLHDISHFDHFYEPLILCKLVNAAPIFCITCSIYSMVAISVERYRSIVTQSSSLISTKFTCKVIGASWLFSLLLSLPTMLEFNKFPISEEQRLSTEAYYANETLYNCEPTFGQVYSIVNVTVVILLSYIVPQMIVYTNYARLIRFIWTRAREISAGVGALNTSAVSKNKVKIVKMLIWAAVLLSVSWIPYFTLMIISTVSGTNDSSSAVGAPYMSNLALATFSTSYNIVLYLSFNEQFQRAYRRLLCCCLKRGQVAPLDDSMLLGTNTLPVWSVSLKAYPSLQPLASLPKNENGSDMPQTSGQDPANC